MKWLIACIVGAAAFFLVLDTGSRDFTGHLSLASRIAIRCYVCNSYFQKTCSDWFDNRTYNLDKCADGVTMCRKIVQEVYYNDAWDIRYIRQCAPSGEVGGDQGRQCQERTGTYRVKMRYCHCDNQDGCNGAGALPMSLLIKILPVFMTIVLIFTKL